MFTLRPHTRIQFHALKTHGASNMNRDDMGRPKEMKFGGRRRLRLSSQSRKHAIRKSEIFESFREHARKAYGAVGMVRTRYAAAALKESLEKLGVSEEVTARAVAELPALMKKGDSEEGGEVSKAEGAASGGKAGKKKAKEAQEGGAPETQLLALSHYEIDRIARFVADGVTSLKEALASWSREHKGMLPRGDLSPEIQLFGRMITAREFFANVDSPLQVSHAFTTHEAAIERDYWIGSDDLAFKYRSDQGASMIEVRQFGSGVFYHYACLDVDLLRSNLEKSFIDLDAFKREALLIDLVSALIWALAVQNPSGYQNSFASHSLADVFVIELGPAFPHSAEAAFEQAVSPGGAGGYMETSIERFNKWDAERHLKYGKELFAPLKAMGLGRKDDMDMTALVSWVESSLKELFEKESSLLMSPGR